jgi:hypothetical protein
MTQSTGLVLDLSVTKSVGIKAAISACLIITVLYLVLQPYLDILYVLSNTSEPIFSLVPFLVALYAVRQRNFAFVSSTRWLVFGFLLWFLGEATYTTYALFFGIAIPYPSLADFFWLSGYPFVLVGMITFLRQFRFALNRRTVALAFSISIAVTGLIVVSLVLPVISSSADLMENIVGLAYPIVDVTLLFASILGALLFRGGKVGRGWYWLVIAVVLFSLGDILFSYLTAKGLYYDGNPLDLFYDYAYIFFGLSIYAQLKHTW